MNQKPNVLTALLFLFAVIAVSAQEVFKNNELTITKLELNMWVVETTDMTTMYIVEGTERAMLIDTGTKTENLDSIVKLITQKPLDVVVTHIHPDHAGNMYFFDQVFFHLADTVLMGLFGKNYSGKISFINDGHIFDLGGTKLEVVFTPGHTPGSIVLIDRAKGNCYSGDSFGSGQVWMQLQPQVSMAVYAESCRKMEALMDEGITKIYCGHYPYVKSAFDKDYINNMRQLAEQLTIGTAPEGDDYPNRVEIGPANPKIVTLNDASIVYDPENISSAKSKK